MRQWARRKWRNLLGRTKLVQELREEIGTLGDLVCEWRAQYHDCYRELRSVYHVSQVPTPKVGAELMRHLIDDTHHVELRVQLRFSYTGAHTGLRDRMMAEELTHRAIGYMKHSLPATFRDQLGEVK